MRRLGRMLVIGLAGVLVVTLAAGAWFALTFDPNAYRDEVAALVRKATGRELVIEGDLSVTLFPRLGIGVGAARLSQAPGFGTRSFATLTEAEADLRLWPLVRHRRVEIGRVRVQGIALELLRRADGSTNWADLADLSLRRDDAGGGPAAIRLSGAEIDGVRVHYVDERRGSEYDLNDGSLRVEGVAISEPFALDGRFRVDHGGRAAQVHVRGEARIDGAQSFELTKPSLTVDVLRGATAHALTIALDAPVVHYAAGTVRVDTPGVQIKSDADSHLQVVGALAAESVTVTRHDAVSIAMPTFVLDLQGADVPGGRARIELRTPALAAALDAQTLSAEGLTIGAEDLKMQASLSGTAILDEPRLAGHVTLAPFSPRTLLERAGQPVELDATALAHAEVSAQYEVSTTALRLSELSLTLDDTHITGEIALRDFTRPTVRFDLAADRLVLDRYVSTNAIGQASKGNGFELSSDAWGALDVEGVLKVADLTVSGLHARDVALSFNGRGAGTGAAAASAGSASHVRMTGRAKN